MPPRPTPFDFTTLFEDDFHRANGNLVGRNGWVTSAYGDPSPIIAANVCTLATQETEDAAQPAVFTGIATSQPWYIEADVTLGVISTLQQSVQFWWGTGIGAYAAFEVDANTAFGGGHNCRITVTDTANTQITADITLASPTAMHTWALLRRGAALVVQLDDVDVVQIPAASNLPSDSTDLVLFLDADPLANLPKVTRIEAAA